MQKLAIVIVMGMCAIALLAWSVSPPQPEKTDPGYVDGYVDGYTVVQICRSPVSGNSTYVYGEATTSEEATNLANKECADFAETEAKIVEHKKDVHKAWCAAHTPAQLTLEEYQDCAELLSGND